MTAGAKPATILVVDDDEGLLLLMAETLRTEGHTVATAQSGAGALDWLERHSADLMLLDLKMGNVGGEALLRRLRQEESPVPFVVVTGQGDERVAVEVMKQGALDYLMKDAAMLDLLPARVSRALAMLAGEKALAAAQAESRRLEREILATGERERRTIGADLHDGLGQQLTAIELMCAGLKADSARVAPDLTDGLDRMGRMLREAIAQTRFLARGLTPLGDEPDALQIGLAGLAARTDALGRLHCRFQCREPVTGPDRVAAGHLYRIAQEAVNNALKHSGARRLDIRLARKNGTLRLEVSDDGAGLPASAASGRGVGLGVMRYRAGLIGADLTIEAKRSGGVAVRCTLPLAP